MIEITSLFEIEEEYKTDFSFLVVLRWSTSAERTDVTGRFIGFSEIAN